MLTSPAPRPSSTDLSFFSRNTVQTKYAPSQPSTVVLTTRLARVPLATGPAQAHREPSPLPPTKTFYPQLTITPPFEDATGRKRKQPVDPPVLFKQAKRAKHRVKNRKRASSTSSSHYRSSPEPIYRSSRSRSTSTFPLCGTDTDSVAEGNAPIPLPQRACGTDANGEPGPSHLSCEIVVKTIMKTYKAYFRNPENPDDTFFEVDEVNYPVASLEYPNNDACERFILLVPKDKDHYNPVMCLEKSLYTIIEYYLTPTQQALFGTLPTGRLTDITTPPTSPRCPQPDPDPSPSSSLSSLTVLSRSPSPVPVHPSPDLLRTLQRSIHLRNGPLFLKTLDSINHLLRLLKYPPLPSDPFLPAPPNPLRTLPHTWPGTIPKRVIYRILDEAYQRAVGPHVQALTQYTAFSSSVYGELMPPLVSDILQQCRAALARPGAVFVDLGSGVGNIVLQAALETGCHAFGVELMHGPASLAHSFIEQVRIRCRMWGVSMGQVEVEEADMLTSSSVAEILPKADVVLVNNKVFKEDLNEALRPKWLDLKEGALVVSLKPFVSSINARVTERNVDDISAIFDVTAHPYRSGSVSWGSGGGNYYVHRVDRAGYADIRERFESSRARRSASARETRGRR